MRVRGDEDRKERRAGENREWREEVEQGGQRQRGGGSTNQVEGRGKEG